MMLDTFRYDEFYYVHDEDDDPLNGESYSDLDDAIDAARADAFGDCVNKEITHILSRVVRRVVVDVHVEEL